MHLELKGGLTHDVDSSRMIIFNADAKVIKVDAITGAPTVEYTVRKCIAYEPWDTTELIAPGAKLTSGRDGKEKALVDPDGTIDPAVLHMVQEAIHDARVGSNSAQNMGNISLPVGGSWKVPNFTEIAGISPSDNVSIANKDADVVLRLASVDDVDGVPTMKLAVDAKLKNIKLPMAKSMKVTKSSAVVQMTVGLPVDKSRPAIASAMTVTFDVVAHGKPEPNIPPMTINAHMLRVVTTDYSGN
jgi:hypothetical protein